MPPKKSNPEPIEETEDSIRSIREAVNAETEALRSQLNDLKTITDKLLKEREEQSTLKDIAELLRKEREDRSALSLLADQLLKERTSAKTESEPTISSSKSSKSPDLAINPVSLRSLSDRDICYFLEKYELYSSSSDNPKPPSVFVPRRLLNLLYLGKDEEEDLVELLKTRIKIQSWNEAKSSLMKIRYNHEIRERNVRFMDYIERWFTYLTTKCEHFSYDLKSLLKVCLKNMEDKDLSFHLLNLLNDGIITDFESLMNYAEEFFAATNIIQRNRAPISSGQPNAPSTNTTEQKKICSYCNNIGHLEAECNKKKRQLLVCSFCNKSGHSLEQCYLKKKSINNLQQHIAVTTNDSNDFLHLDVSIQDISMKAILDTGATFSCIPLNFVEQLKLPIEDKNLIHFSTADGTRSTFLGSCETHLTFNIGGPSESVTLFASLAILPSNSKFLIGCDLLRRLGIMSNKSLMLNLHSFSDVADELPFEERIPSIHLLHDIPYINLGTCSENEQLEQLLVKFEDIHDVLHPDGMKVSPMTIDFFKEDIVHIPARPMSERKLKICNEIFDELIEQKLAEPSNGDFSSPVVLVERPGKSARLTGDYSGPSGVNSKTKPVVPNIPRIDSLFPLIANAYYIAHIDLAKAFWQIPLSSCSIRKTTISIPGRSINFLRAPFGLKNIPAIFQKCMNDIFANIPGIFIYIDDLFVTGSDFESFYQNLSDVYTRVRAFNVTFSSKKSKFITKSEPFEALGFIFHNGIRTPSTTKVEAINKMAVV
ncbi:hypothetical protein RCL1_007906 [Eukaryota sp. TZLM3-RCL]